MSRKIESKQIIRFAESNMNLEGFVVPKRVKKDSLPLIEGTKSADEIVKKYISSYKK